MKVIPMITASLEFSNRIRIVVYFGDYYQADKVKDICYFSLSGFCERFNGSEWVEETGVVNWAKKENLA